MNGFVIEQPLTLLRDGDGDDFARNLVRRWSRSDGYLTSDFAENLDLDRLVMLDAPRADQPSPDILYCGKNALAGKLIGQSWLEQPTKVSAFKTEFRKLVGRHYEKAQKTELPVFDLVSAPTIVNETPYNFRYERLILPVTTLAGSLFLYCYSFAPNFSAQKSYRGSSDECQFDQHRQNTHLVSPPAPAECAILSRADKQSYTPTWPHIPTGPYLGASSHK